MIINSAQSQQLLEMFGQGAKGALSKGTRIRKSFKEWNDVHEHGKEGVVVGSIESPVEVKAKYPLITYAYLVHFDGDPAPTIIVDFKIEEVK